MSFLLQLEQEGFKNLYKDYLTCKIDLLSFISHPIFPISKSNRSFDLLSSAFQL